jgi:DNA-binding beta-propeller fold protein YncE
MVVVFDTAGNFLRQFGQGTLDVPVDVTTDQYGNIFVADIGRIEILEFSSTGTLLRAWDGSDSVSLGDLRYMGSIACDAAGNVLVTNYALDIVRLFDTVGKSIAAYGTTGTGQGQFDTPFGIEIDSGGRLFITDNGNGRVQILDADYSFLSSWPVGNSFYICVDGRGGFYTTRGYDSPPTVLYTNAIDSSTAVLGLEGDSTGAFLRPQGVAVLSDHYLYVADSQRHVVLRFRKR